MSDTTVPPVPPAPTTATGLADWQRVALILGAGAVGGLAYWIIQFSAGATPLRMPWFAGVPASMLLGAVASGVGVYLIANSDTNELRHTMAFALICGIFWSPVIDSGRTFVQGTATLREASDVGRAAGTLRDDIRTRSTEQVAAKVDKTTQMTAKLLQQLPSVNDEDARQHALNQSKLAVDAIGSAAEKAPDKSIEALQQVGAAAGQAGQDAVAKEALARLEAIRARRPNDAIVAEKVRRASATILRSAQSRLVPAPAAPRP